MRTGLNEDRLDPEFTREKLRVTAFPASSSIELEIRLDFELNDDELALMEDECTSIDEPPILSSFRFDNELENPITGATGAFAGASASYATNIDHTTSTNCPKVHAAKSSNNLGNFAAIRVDRKCNYPVIAPVFKR